jgi:hypothetical protein
VLTPPVPPKKKNERKVALKTHNGRYIGAYGGGGSFLTASATTIGAHETFTMITLPGDNKVALRAPSGQYVCAEGRSLVVNRPAVGAWETFTLIPKGKANTVAFKAHTGNYICAEKGGGSTVVVNRSKAAEWETFTLIDVK